MPWEICCITAAENAATAKFLYAFCARPRTQGAVYAGLRCERVSCEGFRPLHGIPESERRRASAELRQFMGAEQLITTMLTPAEFEDYSTKVLNVNGFQSGEEMVDEAKN